jgi:hypothetical protein
MSLTSGERLLARILRTSSRDEMLVKVSQGKVSEADMRRIGLSAGEIGAVVRDAGKIEGAGSPLFRLQHGKKPERRASLPPTPPAPPAKAAASKPTTPPCKENSPSNSPPKRRVSCSVSPGSVLKEQQFEQRQSNGGTPSPAALALKRRTQQPASPHLSGRERTQLRSLLQEQRAVPVPKKVPEQRERSLSETEQEELSELRMKVQVIEQQLSEALSLPFTGEPYEPFAMQLSPSSASSSPLPLGSAHTRSPLAGEGSPRSPLGEQCWRPVGA